MSKSNQLVSPRKYLKFATLLLLGVALYSLLLMMLGPTIHKGVGEATRDEFNSAMWSLATGFVLPAVIVVVTNMSRRQWEGLVGQRVVRWQGQAAVIVILFVSVVMALSLTHAVILADFQKTITDKEGIESTQHLCEMSIVARVQTICSYLGPALTLALAFELFNMPKADDKN